LRQEMTRRLKLHHNQYWVDCSTFRPPICIILL